MLHSAPRLGPLLALLAVNLACGCAADPHRLVLDPIGPELGGRTGFRAAGRGYLQVFSATERRDDGGILYYPHTPYSIYTLAGKHLRGVPNSAGYNDQQPATVELPVGAYVVYAQSERFGQVKVPVQIASGRLTAVHLEGTGMALSGDIPETELVLLPDGRVAGRRAEPEPPQP